MTGSRNDITDRISHEQQRAAADLPLGSSAPASSAEGTSAAGFFTPDASGDQQPFQPAWWRPWIVGVIVLLVIVGSRWPLRTTYLATFDAANFTFALDDFNPAYHRPQPPGDPLFVVVTRALHLAIPAPEQVLPAAGILGSILAVVLLFKLGNAMFGRPVGMCAANPHILPTECSSDGLGDRGLPHTGRAREEENRPLPYSPSFRIGRSRDRLVSHRDVGRFIP
jgi:hypothetical protein